jgi:hypothetical protein
MHGNSEVHVKYSKHTPLARAPVGPVCMVSIAHVCATRGQSDSTLWVARQGWVCDSGCGWWASPATKQGSCCSGCLAACNKHKCTAITHVMLVFPAGKVGCTATSADPSPTWPFPAPDPVGLPAAAAEASSACTADLLLLQCIPSERLALHVLTTVSFCLHRPRGGSATHYASPAWSTGATTVT